MLSSHPPGKAASSLPPPLSERQRRIKKAFPDIKFPNNPFTNTPATYQYFCESLKKGYVHKFLTALYSDPNFDINRSDPQGNSWLHYAVLINSPALLQLLLQEGAICSANNLEQTPRMMAVLLGRRLCIDVIDSPTIVTETLGPPTTHRLHKEIYHTDRMPFKNPIMKEDINAISLLINNQIKISKNDLVQALYTGNAALFITLAQAHPTPLPSYLVHIAVKRKSEDALRYLLNAQVSCSDADEQGYTPLHHAAEQGDIMLTLQLIKAGAPLNTPNKAGNTPLALAAQSLRYEVCCILHGAKAMLFTKNHQGLSPYVLALNASKSAPTVPLPLEQDKPKIGAVPIRRAKEPLALIYLRKKSGFMEASPIKIEPKPKINTAEKLKSKGIMPQFKESTTTKTTEDNRPFVKQGRFKKPYKAKS